jgi:spore coat protein U-like protein
MRCKHFSAAAAFAVMINAGTAVAESDTGSLGVSATVQNSCSLTGGTMDFGTYVSGQTSDLEAQGSIAFANCPIGTMTFELAAGQSNNVNARFMTDGGQQQLDYQIYRDPNRTAVWGEGTDANVIQRFVAGNGTVSVYGSIPGNQTVTAGSFSDTIAMTMTF